MYSKYISTSYILLSNARNFEFKTGYEKKTRKLEIEKA
jgi:hypothetical protein